MQMYSTVGSNDLEKAMPFYDALLGSIGWNKMFDSSRGGRFYGQLGQGVFAVMTPYNEEQASVGNGMMIGFNLDGPAQVDAFHAKALSLGATDEGAPGYRGGPEVGAYFGYFRDLDGNKLCGFHWAPRRAGG